jgi:predicted DNA-binding transcriptional regulator AlpA
MAPNMDYDENRELVSLAAAARALRMSKPAVYQWVRKGIMPSVEIAGRLLVTGEVVAEFREKLQQRKKLNDFFAGEK